jgi:uncharacterized protein (TIGR00369 family)
MAMEKRTIVDDFCFCCGSKNSKGLKLKFIYPEEGSAETECEIPAYFTGWKSITHGGLLAMLLDETMAHACISGGQSSVTVELTVRFIKPVDVGESVTVRAQISGVKSRIVQTEGWIYKNDGELIAKGKARFFKA